MTTPELHQVLLENISRIITSSNGKPKQVYGRDLIDLPAEELILYGLKQSYNDGTIELTLTTPMAHPAFEWLAEVTIKEPDNVEHYLLKQDLTIVETYGKNVFAVPAERAASLLKRLQKL